MLSIEEADAALARLGAEHDAISAKLLELEGTTAKRWSAASSAILDLWARFDTCGQVLDQAREVRARRWWPGISELAELTELLTGPAVPLSALQTQDPSGPRRASLDEAVAGMKAACIDVVAELRDAASATAGDPLEERAELRGRLGAYRAKAARLGYAEDLTLHELYQNAHRLLRTAPCDLKTAAAAVRNYHQSLTAIYTFSSRDGRQRLPRGSAPSSRDGRQ